MKNKTAILVLHSRLSDYFLNVFYEFKKHNQEIDIHIVYKSADNELAPFQFDFKKYNLFVYDESKYDLLNLKQLTEQINPKIIICNSWGVNKYLRTVKYYKGKCKTIMNMDNQFHGTLKQYLGIIYSNLYLRKLFDKVWVPGAPQKKFALKLGFNANSILTGWYVANESLFKKQEEDIRIKKRFVFVGRYIQIKGIEKLCNSFIKLQNKFPNTWELHCIGTGPLEATLKKHPNIIHHGFIQPVEMTKFIAEGGVFVLPSEFEPWGVVVHEFAMSGYPIICSSKVGSATEFISCKNGLVYDQNDNDGLYNSLKTFIKKDSIELSNMSIESIELSKKITIDDWIKKLRNEL